MLTKEGFRKLFSLIGRNSQGIFILFFYYCFSSFRINANRSINFNIGIGTSPFSVYVEKSSKLKGLNKLDKKKLNKHIDKIYDHLDRSIIDLIFLYLKLIKLFINLKFQLLVHF